MTRPSNGSLDLCSEEMSQALDILKQDAETVRQILHTYGAHLQTAYDKIKDLSFLEKNAPEFLNDITRIKGRVPYPGSQLLFCLITNLVVAQWVRAFASQAEGWVFDSQSRQT